MSLKKDFNEIMYWLMVDKFVIDAGLKIGNEEERIYPVLVLGSN